MYFILGCEYVQKWNRKFGRTKDKVGWQQHVTCKTYKLKLTESLGWKAIVKLQKSKRRYNNNRNTKQAAHSPMLLQYHCSQSLALYITWLARMSHVTCSYIHPTHGPISHSLINRATKTHPPQAIPSVHQARACSDDTSCVSNQRAVTCHVTQD